MNKKLENFIVTKEVAIKLKEIGFNYETLYYYNLNNNTLELNPIKNHNECEIKVSAPFYSQVFDFLSELGIEIEIGIDISHGRHYYYNVYALLNKKYLHIFKKFGNIAYYQDCVNSVFNLVISILI